MEVPTFLQNEYPRTTNEDIRLSSHGDGLFQWQIGGFFFAEDSTLHDANETLQPSGGYNEYFGFKYTLGSRSRAGYGQASYKLTDKVKLSAGARYTSDSKHEEGFYGNLDANIVYANVAGSASSSKVTYHAGVDYQATPENLLYAKFDTGYKTGGFNLGGSQYSPENVVSYEIGSKNRFLDNRLQFNMAAFYSIYTDQQVSSFAYLPNGSAVALTQNAGKSRIYGVESDVIYTVPSVGTFNATLDYLHARFVDFVSIADPSDPSQSGNIQLAGNRPPQAPTWTAAVGFKRDFDLFDGKLTFNAQSKIQSSSYFSFYNYPNTRQKSYAMSNAFLSYAPAGDRWKATVFVKNLENRTVFSTAAQDTYSVSYAYQYYPPRTFGGRIELNW